LGKEKYKENIDFQEFINWAQSIKNPAFISEAEDLTPFGFTEIFRVEQASKLNDADNSSKRVERLFWNGKVLE